MTLHALTELHDTARSEAHPMLTQTCARCSQDCCHVRRQVSQYSACCSPQRLRHHDNSNKVADGHMERQDEANDQDACTQLAACSDETGNMIAVLSMVSAMAEHNWTKKARRDILKV